MELMDGIRDRRSVREYTETQVDRTTIERLLEAANLAPSAMNLQPWSFAVLLDRQRVENYAKRAKEWLIPTLAQASHEPSFLHTLEDPQYDLFYHAPALVIILAKSADTQAAEDCCLAAQNLMLAARDEGVGTCWIGLARPWLDLSATKAELGLPENYHVIAPIVLGYPKSWPDPKERNLKETFWL